MNKQAFLAALRRGLSQLPPEEIEKQAAYYSELIDDMCEDGMTEYEAVKKLGSVEDIYRDILQNMPLPLLVKSRAKPKGGWTALSIVLIVLGFPIWFSLAVTVFAVALSLYIVIWALVIVAFAVVLSFAACALGALLVFVRALFSGAAPALLALGCALVLAGLAIVAWLLAVAFAKLIVKATGAMGRGIKRVFIRKEKDREI